MKTETFLSALWLIVPFLWHFLLWSIDAIVHSRFLSLTFFSSIFHLCAVMGTQFSERYLEFRFCRSLLLSDVSFVISPCEPLICCFHTSFLSDDKNEMKSEFWLVIIDFLMVCYQSFLSVIFVLTFLFLTGHRSYF